MTGGFHLKQDADGYGSSPQELERAEIEAKPDKCDRCGYEVDLGADVMLIDAEWLCQRCAFNEHADLECLEKGLQALKVAKGWLESGGYCLPRQVSEEIGQIKLAIGLMKGNEP